MGIDQSFCVNGEAGSELLVGEHFLFPEPSGFLANRLVGYLHGCLRSRTHYNEHTAWAHRQHPTNTNRCLTLTTLGCLAWRK